MIYGGFRLRVFVTIGTLGTASIIASPAVADTNLIIKMPSCNGCTVTAVHSVHAGWDAIDGSATWHRSTQVHKGVARLTVPSGRTRGLAFALDAGKYDGGGSVPMLVLRYAGKPAGSKVGWFASAQAKRASFCWAGTDKRRASLKVRTQRSIDRSIPRGAPGRYQIRAWVSPTQPTLRDDLNMDPTNDGGLGIQQGPYCFDSGVSSTLAVGAKVPAGGSVWIKPVDSTYQMLRLWRSGTTLRLYRDEGNYPGDGQYCSWGALRGNRFVGREQRLAPEPVKTRYTIRKKGSRLKVLGLTGSAQEDHLPWRRASVRKYFQLVPEAGGYTGSWCRTFKSLG